MEVHYITVVSVLSTIWPRAGSPPGLVSGRSRRFALEGSAPLGSGGLLELADLALEVRKLLESLVDGGESQVRDRVEDPQPLEHGHTDAIAGHLTAVGS